MFWFQPKSEKQRVENFKKVLNDNTNGIIELCVDYEVVTHEDIIVARDRNDNKLYRARLVTWDYDQFTNEYKTATICFIDYGHTQKCDTVDLFVFTRANEMATMPPRCFQCRLAEIQPSTANISGGNMWDHDAINLFKRFVFDCDVKAEVSSIIIIRTFQSIYSTKF